METTIQRLQLHTQNEILVLNEPEQFAELTNNLNCSIIGSLLKTSSVSCAVLFVTTKQDLFNQMITLFPKLTDDSILWIAYPKQTSKSYILELYNHEAWEEIKDYSLQPVRKIELLDRWNALRFRKIEYLKN
ncbi:hypothetical protein [Formosa algae]|uniref:Uncharacterized protein n=1 Tax=Formosa algae TaxID=225843 RepID=A0A9X0YJD3_9FLAO|nr:hypothetical protein [Formosa algae]MBP1839664.1 hypothetical protein [Formosa algae]MDQ0334968.1 hypothetical protein [Formosa algae]OEI81610.1 hypothetical protein AST99_03270 [Formosa algae]